MVCPPSFFYGPPKKFRVLPGFKGGLPASLLCFLRMLFFWGGGKEDSALVPFARLGPRIAWETQKKMEGTLLLGGPNRGTRRGASPLGIIPRKTEKFSFFSENAKKPPPFEPQGQKS